MNLSPTIAGFGTYWVCIVQRARHSASGALGGSGLRPYNTASIQAMSHMISYPIKSLGNLGGRSNRPMFSPVPALQNLKPHGDVLNVWECTGQFAQIPGSWGCCGICVTEKRSGKPETPNFPNPTRHEQARNPGVLNLESETLVFKYELRTNDSCGDRTLSSKH